jgi:hypothetical protein
MMDLREATKTLDAYSILIVSKTSYCEKVSKAGAFREARKSIDAVITALKTETREVSIIAALVAEELIQHSKKFVADFVEELTELIEALNRSQVATDRARMVTQIHREIPERKQPEESPSARMIREFRASLGRRTEIEPRSRA